MWRDEENADSESCPSQEGLRDCLALSYGCMIAIYSEDFLAGLVGRLLNSLEDLIHLVTGRLNIVCLWWGSRGTGALKISDRRSRSVPQVRMSEWPKVELEVVRNNETYL